VGVNLGLGTHNCYSMRPKDILKQLRQSEQRMSLVSFAKFLLNKAGNRTLSRSDSSVV